MDLTDFQEKLFHKLDNHAFMDYPGIDTEELLYACIEAMDKLKEQYNLKNKIEVIDFDPIEDNEYVKDLAWDISNEYVECGQGFGQDEFDFKVQYLNNIYNCHVELYIESAKQDRGDRLYWIDGVKKVTVTKL